MNTAIKNLIHSNPVIFDLCFKGYENGKIIYSEPTQYAISKAEKDLKLFEERQEAIYKRTKISDGDWVLLKNGEYSRVTVSQWEDSIQIGGYFGSSVYINSNGSGSYSGGCGDSIDKSKLVHVGEHKEASCWLFHEGYSGAGRGVYATLKFKVWKEI